MAFELSFKHVRSVETGQAGRQGCDTKSSAPVGLEGIESKLLSEKRRFRDEVGCRRSERCREVRAWRHL